MSKRRNVKATKAKQVLMSRELSRLTEENARLQAILNDILGENVAGDVNWLVKLAPHRKTLTAAIRGGCMPGCTPARISNEQWLQGEGGRPFTVHCQDCTTGSFRRIILGYPEIKEQSDWAQELWGDTNTNPRITINGEPVGLLQTHVNWHLPPGATVHSDNRLGDLVRLEELGIEPEESAAIRRSVRLQHYITTGETTE